MTRYEVLLSKVAVRQLRRLSKAMSQRIREKLHLLAEDPYHKRSGAEIRLLWGHDDPPLYRIRIGDYRVLYFITEEEVRVTEVLHRSRAYRALL